MIALLNGEEGGTLRLFKGGDESVKIVVMDDDFNVIDLTGDTVKLNFYDTLDRRNAAKLSKTATLTSAAKGYATAALATADMTFGPGTYYAFVERDHSGPTTTVARIATTVVVG